MPVIWKYSEDAQNKLQVLRASEAVWSQDVTRMRLGSDLGSDRREQRHCSENPIQEG